MPKKKVEETITEEEDIEGDRAGHCRIAQIEEETAEETIVAEPETEPSEIDKVIAEAPELAEVIKNPWLYTEWLNKLRRLKK